MIPHRGRTCKSANTRSALLHLDLGRYFVEAVIHITASRRPEASIGTYQQWIMSQRLQICMIERTPTCDLKGSKQLI